MSEPTVVDPREIELVFDAHAHLGEGPSWDATTGTLIWVDIMRGLVHRFDPSTGGNETWPVGQHVGAAVPCASGSIAVAMRDGFGLLDPVSGKLDLVAPVEADWAHTRMNDGKCDSAGRFWAGTNAYGGTRGVGSLYRFETDRSATRVLPGVSIANGLGWSPDDRLMYYIDTFEYRVDVFDFDPATGEPTNRRPLVGLPDSTGLLDGMAVDAEGFLWIALWNGGAIHRYAPDGRLDRIVRTSVTHPTSCCFGGSDLEVLFVTSASGGEPDRFAPGFLAPQPHAGGLFRHLPGVKGLPTNPYRG